MKQIICLGLSMSNLTRLSVLQGFELECKNERNAIIVCFKKKKQTETVFGFGRQLCIEWYCFARERLYICPGVLVPLRTLS